LWAPHACNKPINTKLNPEYFRGEFLTFLTALQIAIPTDFTSLLWILIILVIIALVIIVILGFLFAFPVAFLAALLVWVLTGGLSGGGDLFLTAVTFLVVAIISAVIGRAWRATAHRGHTHEHEHTNEREHEHHSD
jgi:membrane protein implicated in regulation of membrane protease activity